jgi:hypothetical protein
LADSVLKELHGMITHSEESLKNRTIMRVNIATSCVGIYY